MLKIHLVHICSSRIPHGANGSNLPLGSHQRHGLFTHFEDLWRQFLPNTRTSQRFSQIQKDNLLQQRATAAHNSISSFFGVYHEVMRSKARGSFSSYVKSLHCIIKCYWHLQITELRSNTQAFALVEWECNLFAKSCFAKPRCCWVSHSTNAFPASTGPNHTTHKQGYICWNLFGYLPWWPLKIFS